MKGWTRIFFFLFLNVLVSACVTIAVLIYWERSLGLQAIEVISYIEQNYLSQTIPTPTPVPEDSPAPKVTPTESFFVHRVESGETFESIAEDYNMSVEELIAVNGFSKSLPLGDGEVLRIPENPKGVVIIDSVIGPGDIETEKVLLRHRGEGEFSLAGWQLTSKNGDVYEFPFVPELVLYKNGAVYVNSTKGADMVIDLFWGLDEPVWKPGQKVTLRDTQGTPRHTYTIP
jgi:LysM repeat protein